MICAAFGERLRRRQRAVQKIEAAGATVRYGWEIENNGARAPDAKPAQPAWLREIVGRLVFDEVREVSFYNQNCDKIARVAPCLREFPGLKRVWLLNVPGSDAYRWTLRREFPGVEILAIDEFAWRGSAVE